MKSNMPDLSQLHILKQLAGGADRFAIVDTETTGLTPYEDSIVEIAIITIGLDGKVTDRWDTLIRPKRRMGATHIHKIKSSQVLTAPTFRQVSGDIAERLNGACLVAHNVSFDVGMLSGDLSRTSGVEWRFGDCLDTKIIYPCKLAQAYKQFGVSAQVAHTALWDTYVCSLLFLHGFHLFTTEGSPTFMRTCKRKSLWVMSRTKDFCSKTEESKKAELFFS